MASVVAPVNDGTDSYAISLDIRTGRPAGSLQDFVSNTDGPSLIVYGRQTVFIRAVDGVIVPSFTTDYYNRLHISPTKIDVGNLLSEQVRTIEIWNAYLTPQLLSAIVETETEGISVSPGAPLTLAGLESKIFTITIGTVGPAAIDGSFEFVFPSYSLTVTVVGSRMIVWPFCPQMDYSETLEFFTAISKLRNGEQRTALRPIPRTVTASRYVLTPNHYSRIKALVSGWGVRTFGVPVWPEASAPQAVAAGATVLSVDTVRTSYRAGGLAVIRQDDNVFEIVDVMSVGTGSITIERPTVRAYTAAQVMPCLLSTIDDGFSADVSAVARIRGDMRFVATDAPDLSDDVGMTQLRGKDLFLRGLLVESGAEKVVVEADQFDARVGKIVYSPTRDFADHERRLAIRTKSRDDAKEIKAWLYSMRGRQKSFFIPTWNNDINFSEDVPAGSTVAKIHSIGYALYYGIRDIMFEMRSGARYIMQISQAVDNGDGTETITFLSAFPVLAKPTDFKSACFIEHVRFDSDRLEIRYGEGAGYATIMAPIRVIPEQ